MGNGNDDADLGRRALGHLLTPHGEREHGTLELDGTWVPAS